MNEQPKLTSKDEVPPAVQALCDRVHAVADALPTLVFIPNANHTMLYPVVVVRENAQAFAKQINAFLLGQQLPPARDVLRQKHDLTLEAIHAASDYLPTIVFLPSVDGLHPVNLVSEDVADHLKPCYQAVQRAQKTAIGVQPIRVTQSAATV